MEREYAEKYGEALLDYAFDMLWKRETCGVNHAEFIFVRLTKLLKDQLELKEWFLKNIETTLNGDWRDLPKLEQRPMGFMPSELIEYISHVFRWPELKGIAIRELEKHRDDRIYLMNRNLPSSILDALKDNWEDVEFYASLQH